MRALAALLLVSIPSIASARDLAVHPGSLTGSHTNARTEFEDFGMKPPHVPMIATVHDDLKLEIHLVVDAP